MVKSDNVKMSVNVNHLNESESQNLLKNFSTLPNAQNKDNEDRLNKATCLMKSRRVNGFG